MDIDDFLMDDFNDFPDYEELYLLNLVEERWGEFFSHECP